MSAALVRSTPNQEQHRMKTPFAGFPPETLRFLGDLKRNNNREWFQQNREVFETGVKRPMVELVEALGEAIQGFAPELNTDPKRAIFRIYRDTRFSPDKTPYKTQIAAHFSRRSPQQRTFAGLYFHVSPEEVLVAGGLYMPGSEELLQIRNHIAAHGDELRRILRDRRLRKYYGGLQGDQAKRPPRGFQADHPHIDLIRYKQYVLWVEKPPSLARKPELFRTILQGFLAAMPLVRFLNTPL
jgi:uncharacterized protein (TIGR02453 family)